MTISAPWVWFLRKAAWLSRELSTTRFIVRVFLLFFLLLLGIGFGGAVQSELAGIGAGQTELAYSVVSLRNGARLTPMQDEVSYTLTTTQDASLQRYFSVNPSTGMLSLRDGLKSLPPTSNPLSSFPLQIQPHPPEGEAGPGAEGSFKNIYLQVVSCGEFLSPPIPLSDSTADKNSSPSAKSPAAEASPRPKQPSMSEADKVLQCAAAYPMVRRSVSLANVQAWIRAKGQAAKLLDFQINKYLCDAEDILIPPGSTLIPRTDCHSPIAPGEETKQKVAKTRIEPREIRVSSLLLLQDKADPGLVILPASVAVNGQPPDTGAGKSEAARTLLRRLDSLILSMVLLRYPVLISLGLLLPLLVLIMAQRDVVVRRCLVPYLLLVLAQVITMVIAEPLMGEGLVVWVGFGYTLLRVLQLIGLLRLGRAASDRARRPFDLRRRPWLRRLLRLELLLWGINALGLGWHILGVFWDFPSISPA